MSDDIPEAFTPEDFAQSAEHGGLLGPAYFAARRVCERALADFQAEHAKPLVDDIVQNIADRLWDSVQSSLWGDVELNLQSQMWGMVDETVKALLSGQRWALERYALGSRYDHQAVRAAIAKHIPTELQDARIAELEAKIASLEESMKWARS